MMAETDIANVFGETINIFLQGLRNSDNWNLVVKYSLNTRQFTWIVKTETVMICAPVFEYNDWRFYPTFYPVPIGQIWVCYVKIDDVISILTFFVEHSDDK